MSDPYRLDPVALDRHITGNYGQDQYRDELDELEYEDALEDDLSDDEADIEAMRACARPGRYGCGYCDACDEYHDQMYDAMRDEMDGL